MRAAERVVDADWEVKVSVAVAEALRLPFMLAVVVAWTALSLPMGMFSLVLELMGTEVLTLPCASAVQPRRRLPVEV